MTEKNDNTSGEAAAPNYWAKGALIARFEEQRRKLNSSAQQKLGPVPRDLWFELLDIVEPLKDAALEQLECGYKDYAAGCVTEEDIAAELNSARARHLLQQNEARDRGGRVEESAVVAGPDELDVVGSFGDVRFAIDALTNGGMPRHARHEELVSLAAQFVYAARLGRIESHLERLLDKHREVRPA
jgi:hypothetical protein